MPYTMSVSHPVNDTFQHYIKWWCPLGSIYLFCVCLLSTYSTTAWKLITVNYLFFNNVSADFCRTLSWCTAVTSYPDIVGSLSSVVDLGSLLPHSCQSRHRGSFLSSLRPTVEKLPTCAQHDLDNNPLY